MSWFDGMFSSRYSDLGMNPPSYGSSKCNHRGSLYTSWEQIASGQKTVTREDGTKDVLEMTRWERCNKCGAHRLVVVDVKNDTLTIKDATDTTDQEVLS